MVENVSLILSTLRIPRSNGSTRLARSRLELAVSVLFFNVLFGFLSSPASPTEWTRKNRLDGVIKYDKVGTLRLSNKPVSVYI